MVKEYNPPKVVHPTIEELLPVKKSFFGSLFAGGKPASKPGTMIPSELPKGLYMYGDVGSGKTMLMDLFYDTLPPNIQHRKRIHFHNFMQDVHKRLHKMRLQHGTDLDAIPFVAADIAEESSVLCFDEFQCTDVADAMILRRLVDNLNMLPVPETQLFSPPCLAKPIQKRDCPLTENKQTPRIFNVTWCCARNDLQSTS